ncbi:hypothetical protein OKW21_003277 [Catalinimonas alkaloidigena]|uniref:YfhO family protein n=1 Tax=Catalinimonas alkaloidigena TaxID=1075417 RepID=UPI0024073771|nr:YfhO family protein [Catalinimonas alkaloidigena]MDF9798014.1 hypothetical protein [Catalinimonas alkaloidigena]
MPKIDFKKQVLPHLVAVIIFLIVTIMFFSPMFFENKTLQQTDVLMGLSSGQELKEYRERTGEEALWTNAMFSGMPAYLISIRYQGEAIIDFLQNLYSFWLPRQAEVIFKGFLSFYILLVIFGVRPYLAIAGAIAYGLGTFNIVSLGAGHIWKVEAIAYMPLVLAGIHLTYRGKLLWGFTLTAVALALEIDSNHLQITYYLLLVVLIYGIAMLVDAIKKKNLKPFVTQSLILILAAALGAGTNLGRLWNTYQYGQYSTRGPSPLSESVASGDDEGLDRDYVFNYSIGIAETFTLMVPDFSGGASNRNIGMDSELAEMLQSANVSRQQIQGFVSNAPTYWGSKPSTAGPTYAGAIVAFLFFIGCFFASKKHRIWLIIATVFSIMLSWGNNFSSFNYLIYDVLPGYNKFRVVEMALVIALLCIPILAFLGIEHLLRSEWNAGTKKRFFIASAIPLGLMLLLIVFGGVFSFSGAGDSRLAQMGGEAMVDAVKEDRVSLLRSDAFRTLFFSLLAAVLIFFYKGKKFAFIWLAVGIIALSSVDMWTVAKRFISEDNYVRERNKFDVMTASEADNFILEQNENRARVLNLQNPWNDGITSYYHSSIGGYHGAKLGRYQDLINYYLNDELVGIIQNLQNNSTNFTNLQVLNMLNARFFKAGAAQNAVLINDQALGNVWLVGNIQKVSNADEAIEALSTADLASTAILNTSDFSMEQNSFNQQGDIQMTNYEPNELTYQADVQEESFAVFSEIYYPEGWQAYIDDEPVEHVRVNYILRGLSIPAGQHSIRFEFKPQSYYVGSSVSLVCSILLSIMLVVSLGMSAKNLRKES